VSSRRRLSALSPVAIACAIVAAALVGPLTCSDARAATGDVPAPPWTDAPPWFAFVPRLGLVAYGRGEQHLACDGNCAGFAGTRAGYAHEPAFTFGADVLFALGRYVRVGPSWQYTFTNEVSLEGRGAFGVGDDWSAAAVVEGFIPLGTRWAIAPRIRAGVLVLTPESDLRNYLSSLRDEFCPVLGSDCPISTDTRVGWNIAAGVGGSFRVHEHLRARLDFSAEYYSLTLYTVHAALFSNPIEASESLSGGRLLVTVGVEVF
jgi:hypothetical protein